ncbi:hypothetical protein ES705_23604 [subsurface metagenome]
MLTKAEKKEREKELEQKAILRDIKKEKKEKELRIALEEGNDRLEFAEEYLKNHTFLSTKRLSILYESLEKNDGKPSRSNVWYFGAILRSFREKGLIEKYNNKQYKKIEA